MFLLGAGFSRGAGIPLAAEIPQLLIQALLGDGATEHARHLEAAQRDLSAVQGGASVPMDTWFEYLGSLADLLTTGAMRAGAAHPNLPLDERGRTRSAQEDASAREAFRQLVADLPRRFQVAMAKCQKAAVDSRQDTYIANFAKELREGDSILTFNWDTLLERHLVAKFSEIHWGFAETGSGFPYYKLHCSLDWLVEGVTNTDHQKLLQRTELPFEIQSASPGWDWSEVGRRSGEELAIAQLRIAQGWPQLGWIGFGSGRPFAALPGIARVWKAGLQALVQAEELYVLGYSLPVADLMGRMLLLWAMRGRMQARLGVWPTFRVIDPAAAETAQRLFPMVGHWPTLVPQRAEDVCDWAALLG